MMNLHLETDSQILEAYKSGERDIAATAFVRKHQRFVYSVAMRHLNNAEDARDAAQETFIRALARLDTFRGDSALQTWLYRITVNVSLSMLRRKRFVSFFALGEGNGERDVMSDAQTSPEQHTRTSEFERFFTTVLKQIPRKQRETFCMRYYDELSYDEISEIVGTSVGALKANYHWAVKKIAAQLRASEFYEPWHEHENK
ncbi:MAG: sigma-70 family RNA polymerase sigma factor [Ignavibacteria bacterium]|nr:sigma-70 family RNA polymerase sigma factor [Ignavibacteria bacterium]